jgi:hypothetical protein
MSPEYKSPVITDLSEFGYREKSLAAELLSAYVKTPDVLGYGVTVAMNANSGYVFLSDEDYRVAMLNGDKLEEFFSCPECGYEGFKEDFRDQDCEDCQKKAMR